MEITKKEFMRYEEIRKSGKVNMFDFLDICNLCNFDKNKLFEIMKNYNNFYNKYIQRSK